MKATENDKKTQDNSGNIAFEELLEELLKVKPPEKKKTVKKEKSKPKK